MTGRQAGPGDAGDVEACHKCGGALAPGESRCFWCGALRWRSPVAGPGALIRAAARALLPSSWRRGQASKGTQGRPQGDPRKDGGA